MYQGQPNASSATGTRNRVPDPSPSSGICSVCLDGCPGTCEIARSSYRGREVLYPGPFGRITAGATKGFPVDYSHLSIQGTCIGAVGIEADPDRAVFHAVSTETTLGRDRAIRLSIPVFIGALGSTDVARGNWGAIAAGAAISGIIVTIGENVAGMGPEAVFKGGRLVRSPELEKRVRAFREWQDGYGDVVLQQNVEDMRVGSAEYAIDRLGISAVEIKWGQGAKDIGGEVKVRDLERALELKRRGYIQGFRPCQGHQVRLRRWYRPSDHRRLRGRNRNEPLEDDERVGDPYHLSPIPRLPLCLEAQRAGMLCPAPCHSRWPLPGGPCLQGLGPRRPFLQGRLYGKGLHDTCLPGKEHKGLA